MKITNISIKMDSSRDGTFLPVTLIRDENKVWIVMEEDGTARGLFPIEIYLANLIQVEIVQKFGATPKKEK